MILIGIAMYLLMTLIACTKFDLVQIIVYIIDPTTLEYGTITMYSLSYFMVEHHSFDSLKCPPRQTFTTLAFFIENLEITFCRYDDIKSIILD